MTYLLIFYRKPSSKTPPYNKPLPYVPPAPAAMPFMGYPYIGASIGRSVYYPNMPQETSVAGYSTQPKYLFYEDHDDNLMPDTIANYHMA